MTKLFCKLSFSLFVLTAFGLLAPQTLFCQAEKLGIVKYTSPKGMTKLPKENVVSFSELNQQTGKYCIITLYGATPGTGNAESDFKREWNNLVVKMMKVEANPTTDTSTADGWTILAGGSAVESEMGKSVAFLTVVSREVTTVSILAVFNDPAYVKQVDTFISAIAMDKPLAPSNNTAAATTAPTLDQWGNLFIPPPTRQLTIADLVGNWGDNPGRIATTYVYKSDGANAGTDSLHYTSKSTIDSDGKYGNDFFEVRNGQKLRDITTGRVSIEGRVLTIKQKGTTKYFIRGWLELADMTIMKLIGPWNDNQEIPAEIFNNPEQGENLSHKWIRLK